MRKMNDVGYALLTASIIKQAAIDYWHDCAKGVYRRNKKMSDEEHDVHVYKLELERKRRKREEQQFFNSDWFRFLLTDEFVTGEKMMKQIELLRSKNRTVHFTGILAEDPGTT